MIWDTCYSLHVNMPYLLTIWDMLSCHTYHMGLMDTQLYAWYHATWCGIHDIMSLCMIPWYMIWDTWYSLYGIYRIYGISCHCDTWDLHTMWDPRYYLVSLIPAILYYTTLYYVLNYYMHTHTQTHTHAAQSSNDNDTNSRPQLQRRLQHQKRQLFEHFTKYQSSHATSFP